MRKELRSLERTSIPPGSRERTLSARDYVQRGTAFRAGLGKNQRTIGEVEGSDSCLPASFASGARQWSGPQSSAEAPARGRRRPLLQIRLPTHRISPNGTALHTCKRRLSGSQQESAGQPILLQRLPDDAEFKSSDVGRYVRQFWHEN